MTLPSSASNLGWNTPAPYCPPPTHSLCVSNLEGHLPRPLILGIEEPLKLILSSFKMKLDIHRTGTPGGVVLPSRHLYGSPQPPKVC